MSDSYDRWHGSVFFEKVGGGIGYGIFVFSVLFGTSFIVKGCRSTPNYQVQEVKIDGRTFKYCEIEKGKAAVIEVDGKPIIEPSKLEKLAQTQKESEKK
jgi:hypothetical protein